MEILIAIIIVLYVVVKLDGDRQKQAAEVSELEALLWQLPYIEVELRDANVEATKWSGTNRDLDWCYDRGKYRAAQEHYAFVLRKKERVEGRIKFLAKKLETTR